MVMMMSNDLRGYIATLMDAGGQIRVVSDTVSTKFEIAGVTAKADGGQAVLFENIQGKEGFRLVSNLVGTRQRFAMAVGASFVNGIHPRMINALGKSKEPQVISDVDAPFLQNRSRNLSVLPIVSHFEKESGSFVTSSMVHVVNPETKKQNTSFHRLMPIGDTRCSLRMVEGRHLHRCFVDAKEHKEDLRVAITIGVHPAISIAGAYQAGWGVDEMGLANSILDDTLKMCRLPRTRLAVPFGTEIILEGRILQDVTHLEWMVEMLRTYDHKREQPVFELDQMYFRDNPIFHDVLSGYTEHRLLMGMPIESKLNGELSGAFDQVRKVSMSNGGCSWLHAVVQIQKDDTVDTHQIIKKTFELHRSLKQVVLVDADIDPDDAQAVEYAMATRFQADRDLVIIQNVRGSSLDPSSDQERLRTAKMGVDATRPLSKRSEGFELAKIPGIEKMGEDGYLDKDL